MTDQQPTPNDQKPNPEVPPAVAEAFVELMKSHGYSIDYTEESLRGTLEEILASPLFAQGQQGGVTAPGIEGQIDLVSALSAYVGETLARLYRGVWFGHFSSSSDVNFNTSSVAFGDYHLFPTSWLACRVANGRFIEGSVADWLMTVLPSARARIDVRPEKAGEGLRM